MLIETINAHCELAYVGSDFERTSTFTLQLLLPSLSIVALLLYLHELNESNQITKSCMSMSSSSSLRFILIWILLPISGLP